MRLSGITRTQWVRNHSRYLMSGIEMNWINAWIEYIPCMSFICFTQWCLTLSYGIRSLCQLWFRQWLVALWHQAITWTNVHLSSLINTICWTWHISVTPSRCLNFNTLRLRQNGRHFVDDILKSIFLNENVWISIEISLKFVPKGPINNIPALV